MVASTSRFAAACTGSHKLDASPMMPLFPYSPNTATISANTRRTYSNIPLNPSHEGQENAKHLMDVITSVYKITTDWTGTAYCGLTFDCDYEKRTVNLAMLDYVHQTLQCFNHPTPP
jgi:hypothetical protein